jgi:hypothetical protein
MKQQAAFGRRNAAAPIARRAAVAPQGESGEIALTPEQRAYLFGAGAEAGDAAPERPPAPARFAGPVACLSVTALVAALTLLGKPHDTVAALPPGLEDQAKAVFQLAGGWFEPLTLLWSIFVIAANLSANLWLTQKLCFWRGWSGLSAFSATGAGMSVAVAFLTALIGLGDSEIGYALEAFSGGGAAALYRLLAGRRSFP